MGHDRRLCSAPHLGVGGYGSIRRLAPELGPTGCDFEKEKSGRLDEPLTSKPNVPTSISTFPSNLAWENRVALTQRMETRDAACNMEQRVLELLASKRRSA
jgi:hypothetical protein